MAKEEFAEQQESINRVASYFTQNPNLIASYVGFLAKGAGNFLDSALIKNASNFAWGLAKNYWNWNNNNVSPADVYNALYTHTDLFLKNSEIQELVVSNELWEEFSKNKGEVAQNIVAILKVSQDKGEVQELIEEVLETMQQDFLKGKNKESIKKLMIHAAVIIKAASDKKKKLNQLLQEVNDSTQAVHERLLDLISELGLENKKEEIIDLIDESNQEKKKDILSTIIDESKSKLDKEKEKDSLFALIDEGFKLIKTSPRLYGIIFGDKHREAIASIVSHYTKTDVKNPIMAILNPKSFSAVKDVYNEYRNNKNIKLDGILRDPGVQKLVGDAKIWQALNDKKDDIAQSVVKALKIYKDKDKDEVKKFVSTLAGAVAKNQQSILDMMKHAATIFKLNSKRKKQIDNLVTQIDKSKSNKEEMGLLAQQIEEFDFEKSMKILNLVYKTHDKEKRVNSLFTLINKSKLANEELLSKIKRLGLNKKKQEILNLINEPDDKKRDKALSVIINGADKSRLDNDKKKLLLYQIEELGLKNLVNKSKLAKDDLLSQINELELDEKKQEILNLINKPDNKKKALSAIIDEADRNIVATLIDEPELDKKQKKDSLFSLIDKGFELVNDSKQLQETIFNEENHKAMASMASNFMPVEIDIAKPIGAILTADNFAAIEESYKEYRESENPNLGIFLKNTKIQELILNPEIWNTLKNNKSTLAQYAADKLGFSKEQDKAKQSVEKLMGDVSQLFLGGTGENILQNIAILTDEKESDDEKAKSLTRILRRGEELVPLITSPELWQLVEYKKDDLADLAVSALKLPKEQKQEATELFKDLIQISSIISKDNNKEFIQNIIENVAVIIDPERDNTEKMAHSFKLLDQAIQFIESNGNDLQDIQKHKNILAKMLAPHMPPGIKSETIINDVLLNKKTLNDLKKAYTRYRDSNFYMFGAIKAIATVVKSSKLRSLAVTMACNWFVSKMPNFIRRRYANRKINKILKKKKYNDDLAELCAANSADTGFLEKYSLNSRCLKGLDIEHNLDDLTIKGFNFYGAVLGSNDKDFSFANSKISKTNFKNVQFKGKSINISGMEIDGESFVSLLDLLEKCNIKTINKKIKITGVSEDLRKEIEKSEVYKGNKENFEIIQSSKKAKSKEIKPKKTKFEKAKSAFTFVRRLDKARNEAKNNAQNMKKE